MRRRPRKAFRERKGRRCHPKDSRSSISQDMDRSPSFSRAFPSTLQHGFAHTVGNSREHKFCTKLLLLYAIAACETGWANQVRQMPSHRGHSASCGYFRGGRRIHDEFLAVILKVWLGRRWKRRDARESHSFLWRHLDVGGHRESKNEVRAALRHPRDMAFVLPIPAAIGPNRLKVFLPGLPGLNPNTVEALGQVLRVEQQWE